MRKEKLTIYLTPLTQAPQLTPVTVVSGDYAQVPPRKRTDARPAARRKIPRKLRFSLPIKQPSSTAFGWSEPVSEPDFARAEAQRLFTAHVVDASFSYFVVRSSEPKNYREKAAQHAECN